MAATICLALVTVVVTGCGLGGPPDAGIPIDNLSTETRRVPGDIADHPAGPQFEVLSGTVRGVDVTVTIQLDRDGACLFVDRPPNGSQACGPLQADAPLSHAGVMAHDDIDAFELGGVASGEVASITAELSDGRQARAALAPLRDAGIEGSVFLLYVPRGEGIQVVTRAADGTELLRTEISGGS